MSPTGAQSLFIELACDAVVAVRLREFVDQFDYSCRGLAQLPCRLWQLEMQGVRRATIESDLCRNVRPFEQRHIGYEKARHALALAIRGAGIVPELREVLGKVDDARALLVGDSRCIDFTLFLVALVGLFVDAKLLIPFGLQCVGHESVVRVDLHEAPTCEVTFVACALHLLTTHRIVLDTA